MEAEVRRSERQRRAVPLRGLRYLVFVRRPVFDYGSTPLAGGWSPIGGTQMWLLGLYVT